MYDRDLKKLENDWSETSWPLFLLCASSACVCVCVCVSCFVHWCTLKEKLIWFLTDYEEIYPVYFDGNTYLLFNKVMYQVDTSKRSCSVKKVLNLPTENQGFGVTIRYFF